MPVSLVKWTDQTREDDIPQSHKDVNREVMYYSESRKEWMSLDDMNIEHIKNLLIKVLAKDYNGRFRVVTSQTQKHVDEYAVQGYVQ